jgi:hypothetical protein
MDSEPIQVTRKVVSAFEQLDIPYLIGGSFASAVHGVVRATMDADVVADINPSQVPSLVGLLQKEFYISSDMIMEAIRHTSSFNLIHLDTMFKVDVFILKQRPFDLNQMQRRISQSLGDTPDEQAYFCTAEDIILAKLEWYRTGGELSERQWRDILGVLGLQGDRLDFDYLKKWSATLGVQDLLERAVTIIQGKR